MRTRLNSNSSMLSKLLLLMVATGLTLFGLFYIWKNGLVIFSSLLLVLGIGVVWLIVYSNFHEESLEFDDENLYWRPMFSKSVKTIPLKNVTSVTNKTKLIQHEGLKVLKSYQLAFLQGSQLKQIEFTCAEGLLLSGKIREFIAVVTKENPQVEVLNSA